MANVKSNNNDLTMYGEEMTEICKDFLLKIDKFFTLIETVNRTAWSGTSADTYSGIVSQDKKKYEKFGNNMMQYANAIKNAGKNLETVTKKWETK